MKTYNYIYKITNLINGKIYIGKHSTDNLDDGYMGSGKILCYAKKKYGIENFTKEYIAFCDTEDKLNWFERFYIKKFNTRDHNIGYNITAGGEGVLGLSFSPWNKGKNLSEETKKKISDAKKGQPAWNKGKSTPDDVKEKISLSTKNAMQDPEIRQHLSDMKKGKSSHMKGKHLSEETKEKLRNSLSGRQGSPSVWKGKHWYFDKETNKRIYY